MYDTVGFDLESLWLWLKLDMIALTGTAVRRVTWDSSLECDEAANWCNCPIVDGDLCELSFIVGTV